MSMKESTGQKGQELGQMKVIALLVSECRVPHSYSSHLEL